MLGLALGIAAFAAGTVWLGWWAVPLIAILGAVARPAPQSRPVIVALAAALAWAGLLGWQAVRAPGPMVTLTHRVAGIFGVPGPVLLMLPSLYAAVLAWSAATLAALVWKPSWFGLAGR